MERAVIIDLAVAAVLVFFVFCGARRGLFGSAVGLAVVLVALVGANVAADTLTPVAAGIIQPVIEKRVEQRLEKAIESEAPPQEPDGGEDSAVSRVLALLKLDGDPAASILEKAKEQVYQHGTAVVTAVAMSVAASMLRVALFVLGFAVILLALKALVRVTGLVLKLPVLSQANALGGGAVGLVEGALALFVAVWVLRRFGVSFDTETVANTVLLRFFTTQTPLSVLS